MTRDSIAESWGMVGVQVLQMLSVSVLYTSYDSIPNTAGVGARLCCSCQAAADASHPDYAQSLAIKRVACAWSVHAYMGY
jgi:hypothetical protein